MASLGIALSFVLIGEEILNESSTLAQTCHESYSGSGVCIPPPPPKLTCNEIPFRRFDVNHDVEDPDPHGFDPDGNGIGCEGRS